MPRCSLVMLALAMTAPAAAQSITHGIADQPAPPWMADDWINLPKGTYDLEVEDLRGKVVFLVAFQASCPGCQTRALPNLQRLIRHYEGVDDVVFVAIQTTFDNFDLNTSKAAWATAEKFGLQIPVGHSGSFGSPTTFVRRYNSAGTPWTVIIDRDGVIRFNDYHIGFNHALRVIDNLRGVSGQVEGLPASRGGQELVGRTLPELGFDRFIEPLPDYPGKVDELAEAAPATGEPRATLYRWWTDGCPYCKASLPAVEQLRRHYGKQGLRVVAVYHPKPPAPTPDDIILENARYLGYYGQIAVDEDWSALDLAFPPEGRAATSVSLLVDADGVIRFVHPGPVYFPSAEPAYVRENADFRLLDKAVRMVLAEGEADPAQGESGTTPESDP